MISLLPPEWMNKEKVIWSPGRSEDHPTREWVALLWGFLKEQSNNLSIFQEWPLLPTNTGFLFTLKTMSRLLRSATGLTTSMAGLLTKIGCHFLDPDLRVDHPQLQNYVHDATGAGVLDAILASALNSVSNIGALFFNVTIAEKQALRNFLCESNQLTENQINDIRIHVFKCLPVFEVHNVGGHEDKSFVHLEGSNLFLAPSSVDESLLGPQFISVCSDKEAQVLTELLGVQKLGRAEFFRSRALSRLNQLAPDLRDRVVIQILQELPQLCGEDPLFRNTLQNLAFVPTPSGRLKHPGSLYDPRNMEVFNLLTDEESFPSSKFRTPIVLDILCGLGLSNLILPDTILLSARQVESLVSSDLEKALACGHALLSYLELNAHKWLCLPLIGNDMTKGLRWIVSKPAAIFQGQKPDSEAKLLQFWNELINICWCPVLMHPPYVQLPWPLVSCPIAPPKLARMQSDMWLASASMRILDRECHSSALTRHLGWDTRPGGSVLAAQLLELGRNHAVVEDRELGQILASIVPRIYSFLNQLLGTEDMEIVKAILEGCRWIWVGDGFATVQEVAFDGPLHLSPYFRVIPADLAVFKELLTELDVRETLTPTEFTSILSSMAQDADSGHLNSRQLDAAIWIVQHLADAYMNVKDVEIFVPDADATLTPSSKLVYNDAPWLSLSGPMQATPSFSGSGKTLSHHGRGFVHAKISNDVAEKLGICSLRKSLLAESADSMDLGLHEAAEAFGQNEALTTRLKHIVEMYADGPGILYELIQNADDAGATEVSFLLDRSQYGTSSILSPRMADWQGPALYCFNNSVFNSKDLYAIARIGQDTKAENPSAIGRFGLGFNCVYHFTDVPGFVSGANLVIFDPHAKHLPGITPAQPGLKINFVGRGLLNQFPDQFSPFSLFGSDLQKPFPGTLFRFPLRSVVTASRSEIKQEVYSPDDVLILLSAFQSIASEALLFLNNVQRISIYTREQLNQEMQQVFSVNKEVADEFRERSLSHKAVYDFVHGERENPLTREQFVRKLLRTSETQLPWSCVKMKVTMREHMSEKSAIWLVSNALGGRHARELATEKANQIRGFVPWAGIAAYLQNYVEDTREANSEDCRDDTPGTDVPILQLGSTPSKALGSIAGRAFSFLPLPVYTGLPVHVNAYFELSSNRRDIWYGDDMAGGGRLRSSWNISLLEEVAAPAYARLLAEAACELGPSVAYYSLWPTETLRQPWDSLLCQVYYSVVSLQLPVLYTAAGGGRWVTPKQAIFPDYPFAQGTELRDALSETGLPCIDAPAPVVAAFQKFAPSLRYLTPRLLRKWLTGSRRSLKHRRATNLALHYCLSDVEGTNLIEKLQDLPLIPLCNGRFGAFTIPGADVAIVISKDDEYLLLKDFVPHLLVDREVPKEAFSKLQMIAQSGSTNLTLLTAQVLRKILPKILPPDWRGKKVIDWTPGLQGQPSFAWMDTVWKFLRDSCEDLSEFSDWPLLPTSDVKLLQLVSRNSLVIKNDGWSETMVSLFHGIKCFLLTKDIQVHHKNLEAYVHEASAYGVLDLLFVAAHGYVKGLPTVLSRCSASEIRELRRFLCQKKWFETTQVQKLQIEVFRALPIFESGLATSSEVPTFRSLSDCSYIKPDDVDEVLLGKSFIIAETDKEEDVLKTYLGVTKISKKDFYSTHIASALLGIDSDLRGRALVAILHDLSEFLHEDSYWITKFSQLSFVPTAIGTIEAPKRLYDPRVLELQTLLNKEAFFPLKACTDDEMLDTLVILGLRRSLGSEGLLDSAKSVAMLSFSDEHEAFQRGKALLAHLDALMMKYEFLSNDGLDDKNQLCIDNGSSPEEENTYVKFPGSDISVMANQLVQFAIKEEQLGDTSFSRNEATIGDDDLVKAHFWEQLREISWCPVYVDSPLRIIPWIHKLEGSTAPPNIVRSKSQLWLVSATMRIVDADCRSNALLRKLGWAQRPSLSALATQLIELSKTYSQLSSHGCSIRLTNGGCDSCQEVKAEYSEHIPHIYHILQDYIESDNDLLLQSRLEGISWIWVGDGFVSAKDIAFDSPAHFHPYLHVVSSDLSSFKKLLSSLGVQDAFGPADYVRVLHHVAKDVKQATLSSQQLNFVLRVLEALADVLPENAESNALVGGIVIPDAAGLLVPAKSLVYDDAPWLDKSMPVSAGLRLVHPGVDNQFADRLGAKSLRYLSLVDQKMTSNLTCPDFTQISHFHAKVLGQELLLFDLLEIADCCRARKVHVVYDKNEHPKQSLLQPNLSQYQGPALTIAFEGATLSTEEVCALQTFPPIKIQGKVCRYGSSLLSCYHATDLLNVVSGGFLYLFDPSGLTLSSTLADGTSSTQRTLGKAYNIRGTDLPLKFVDQFTPFQVANLSWDSHSSTFIRLPLRSASQARGDQRNAGIEWGEQDIIALFNTFKAHASVSLLFLKSVEYVSLSIWEAGESIPQQLFSVGVDPARAALRNPFQEQKWRKFQLSSIFGGFSLPSKVHTIDILLVENGKQIVDKWLVVQSLASGRTRDMALDKKYLSYNLTPIAGVAAHISRNGSAPPTALESCILAPVPLPTAFNLPVTIMGHFLVSLSGGRHISNCSDTPIKASTAVSQDPAVSQKDRVYAIWNRELLACVCDSYVELLQEVQHLHHFRASLPDASKKLGLNISFLAGTAYSFWPRSKALLPIIGLLESASGQDNCYRNTVNDVTWLVEWLIKPIYLRLADLPVWQLHGGTRTKLAEGVFLAPPGIEHHGVAPQETVCEFLKTHYRVFAVPWDLTLEVKGLGIPIKELTPHTLRNLLKVPTVAAAVPSILTQIDLLDYCSADLHSLISSFEGKGDNTVAPASSIAISSIRRSGQLYNSSDTSPGDMVVGEDGPGFSGIGRLIADFGTGVLEDLNGIRRDRAPSQIQVNCLSERSDAEFSMMVSDMKGLACPTAAGLMVKLGISELWLGNREQQSLLPSLEGKFVHSVCLERSSLRAVLSCEAVQAQLNIRAFSSQLLAANLGVVFSKEWLASSRNGSMLPWVPWDHEMDLSLRGGPSYEWLIYFWKNANPTSEAELSLFSHYPLIPAVASSSILVRLEQRHLVFVPPTCQDHPIDSVVSENRAAMPASGGEAINNSEDLRQAFENIEKHYPWLLPLLQKCQIPVYDRHFLNCNALQCLGSNQGKSIVHVILSTCLALQRAGCLLLPELALTSAECDSLFTFFAACIHEILTSSSSVPTSTLTDEETGFLASLPIFKTKQGNHVALNRESYYFVSPEGFIQPEEENCLPYLSASSGGSLYRCIGIPELAAHDVMARYALPKFDQLSRHQQECVLLYLLGNWSSLKQQVSVVAALKETRFVQNGTYESKLFFPSELFDPENMLLKRIFAGENSKFPADHFCTNDWLLILRDAGLRTATNAELFLECAKKVEEHGKQNVAASDFDDFLEESSSPDGKLSSEVWDMAGMLVQEIIRNLASVYSSNFCDSLSRIVFVPAEKGIPCLGRISQRVLASYNGAVLLKDWPLAWTCSPILAKPGVIPPEFAWGALHLRSPPPIRTVIRHLQEVGKNGGEDTLARWPNMKGSRTVEDVFNDVLKYLSSSWDGLSTSDKHKLRGLHFIPVANSTRLVPASALYVRLGMDLAPFAFELPSIYLEHRNILSTLGLQDTPTLSSMRHLLLELQSKCGYQHINPNELRAIFCILQFICDEEMRVKPNIRTFEDSSKDTVVPDDGARLVHAKHCVYVDPLGVRIIGEFDSSKVRFVHPQLPEQQCVQLGVQKLSDVIVEELDTAKALEFLDSLKGFQLSVLQEKLCSSSFADAIWTIVRDCGRVIPSLQTLTRERVTEILTFCAGRVQFARHLSTKFFMLPGRQDVTRNRHKQFSPLNSDPHNKEEHQVFHFTNKSRQQIYVAEPPDFVSVPEILAVVVSEALGSPICLPISSCFHSNANMEASIKQVLRLGPNSPNSSMYRQMARQSPMIGSEVIDADAVLMHYQPLRPFYSGEIIGWRSNDEDRVKLRYGRVVENVRAPAGQPLYRLQIETSPGEIQLLISSSVLSFKGTAGSSVIDEIPDDFPIATSSLNAAKSSLEERTQQLFSSENIHKETQAVVTTTEQVSRHVHYHEVAQVIRDMLDSVGIPFSLEKHTLLEQALRFQNQLASTNAALSLEQEKADAASKEIELLKSAWSCRVCLSLEVDTMILPCGHVLCQRCSSAVSKCPFCRRPISKALQMYRP
ncbi:hypothetical protein O6H91_02G118900 [Diphasiastrum complanatum]|nr:hypothetical protein O6H91_02G118900 [Diphasiastrum complanatum]